MTPDILEKLSHYLDHPDERDAIEQRLVEAHGRALTILISDMSGFSRTTEKRGIVHFLSLIARQRTLIAPIVEAHGGRVIKFEADNAFAVFDTPQAAVEASRQIHETLAARNAGRPPQDQIVTCHGIATGRVLDFGHDIFGGAVNHASKLGEDVAEDGETLVTAEVYEALTPELQAHFASNEVGLSGIHLDYHTARFVP